MGDFLCPYSIVAILCALVGGALASRREAFHQGMVLGLVFGPFGLIAALLVEGREGCPACHEAVSGGAFLCPHCRTALIWDSSAWRRRPLIHSGSPLAKQLREQGIDPLTFKRMNPAATPEKNSAASS